MKEIKEAFKKFEPLIEHLIEEIIQARLETEKEPLERAIKELTKAQVTTKKDSDKTFNNLRSDNIKLGLSNKYLKEKVDKSTLRVYELESEHEELEDEQKSNFDTISNLKKEVEELKESNEALEKKVTTKSKTYTALNKRYKKAKSDTEQMRELLKKGVGEQANEIHTKGILAGHAERDLLWRTSFQKAKVSDKVIKRIEKECQKKYLTTRKNNRSLK